MAYEKPRVRKSIIVYLKYPLAVVKWEDLIE